METDSLQRFVRRCAWLALVCGLPCTVQADEGTSRTVAVWPQLAPGETQASTGVEWPRRKHENPPATRIGDITKPTLKIFEPSAAARNGTAVIILPGGGFGKIVPDKEGSEFATVLTRLGVTAAVLHYRTKTPYVPGWFRPLQDAQRAVRLLRARADEWQLRADRIGIVGFSAGGQVAARVATGFETPSYVALDDVDAKSCRPDFAMLLYPWRMMDPLTGALYREIQVTAETPPTFLMHAHDDASSSLNSVLYYTALTTHGVAAELHIFQNGGHGYGLREVEGSLVHTWADRAVEWLALRGLVERAR